MYNIKKFILTISVYIFVDVHAIAVSTIDVPCCFSTWASVCDERASLVAFACLVVALAVSPPLQRRDTGTFANAWVAANKKAKRSPTHRCMQHIYTGTYYPFWLLSLGEFHTKEITYRRIVHCWYCRLIASHAYVAFACLLCVNAERNEIDYLQNTSIFHALTHSTMSSARVGRLQAVEYGCEQCKSNRWGIVLLALHSSWWPWRFVCHDWHDSH